MKKQTLFWTISLLFAALAMGCNDDNHKNDDNNKPVTCDDAKLPAGVTTCDCIDGAWLNCIYPGRSCDETQKPQNATACDCKDGTWTNCTYPDGSCDETQKPQDALTCDCTDGTWINCIYPGGCDDNQKPQDATACDCIDGSWTNCTYPDGGCGENPQPQDAATCDCIDGAWSKCIYPESFCESVELPEDALYCQCVDFAWSNCTYPENHCKSDEKPENSEGCQCVEGAWKYCTLPKSACESVEKPDNAVACECVDYQWTNCVYAETCENECQSSPEGYTCDTSLNVCSCHGSFCTWSESCTPTGCWPWLVELFAEFVGDEKEIREDGTNSVRVRLTMNRKPTEDIKLIYTLDNPSHPDNPEIVCADAEGHPYVILNGDNWNTGAEFICKGSGSDHQLELGNYPRILKFSVEDDKLVGDYQNAVQYLDVGFRDTDEIGLIVTEPENLFTTESGGNAVFKVKLLGSPYDKPAKFTVDLYADDSLSTAYPHATVEPSELIFTQENWNVDQTVTVTGTDDGDVCNESTNYHLIICKAPDIQGIYSYLTDVYRQILDNLDNDCGHILTDARTFTMSENGEPAKVKVKLSSAPTVETTVTAELFPNKSCTLYDPARSTPEKPYYLPSATFLFHADDYSTWQELYVKGLDDDYANDADRLCLLNFKATSEDTDPKTTFNGQRKQLRGYVTDDDVADFTGFATDPLVLYENAEGGDDSVTTSIHLTSKPRNDVTIQLSAANEDTNDKTAHIKPSVESIVFTDKNYNVDQQVTWKVVPDKKETTAKIYATLTAKASSEDAKYNEITKTSRVEIANTEKMIIVEPLTDTYLTEFWPENYITVKVKLLAKPTKQVTLVATSSNSSRLLISHQGQLVGEKIITINPKEWDNTYYFNLYPNDDNKQNSVSKARLTIHTESDDVNYKDKSVELPEFTIKDDDRAEIKKLTITCTGMASCAPLLYGSAKCTASLDSKNRPSNGKDVELKCKNSVSGFGVLTKRTLSSSNNWQAVKDDIESPYCGASTVGTGDDTDYLDCTAVNEDGNGFKATGKGSFDFRYHELDYHP